MRAGASGAALAALAALIAAAACAGDSAPAATATPGPAPLPRELIEARFPGQTIGVAAEVARGDYRAAVVWPILEGGGFVDDEVIAVAFVRDGRSRWRPHGLPVSISGDGGRDRLRDLLGGDDRVVHRACGLAKAELIPHVEAQIASFRAAIAAADPAAAAAAYADLTRAFAFELVAYDDLLPEWLIAAASGEGFELRARDGDNGDWLDLEVRIDERLELASVPLVRCGRGWVLGRPADG